MFLTYKEALDWIHSRLRLGIKPGLKRMEWMMEKLGHPEKQLKTVHIGGTNGKGSTVTYLRSILQAGGYTVGTFTSPYIEHFNERISINGVPITDQEIVELANIIFPLAIELEESELGGPTEFEVITAMSMWYFAKCSSADVVIYEVGLGGRFDSTNIIQPMLSIITNIGLDHTQILGNTYEEIAFEKAGIIKKGSAVITGIKRPDALAVIEQQSAKLVTPLFRIGKEFEISGHSALPKGESFDIKTPYGYIENIKIGMMGQHQTENSGLSIMAAQYLNHVHAFKLTEKEIRIGLKNAFWPGRFEILSDQPTVIIDGAHNDEGITALTHELESRYSGRRIHIVFAALTDKKLDKMISKLDSAADRITFVSFDFPRAASASSLMEISSSSNKQVSEEWQAAITNEINQLHSTDILVITGSLYFISEVKPFLSKFFKK